MEKAKQTYGRRRRCWTSGTSVTGELVKRRSQNMRQRPPKEQRACCTATRSQEAVWSPRDAAQGEATNPRDDADLAVKSWARIWRIYVDELQGEDRPWETPDHEEMSELPLLTVDGHAGFTAVVGSFKPKTGIGVDCNSSVCVVAHLRKRVNSCTLTC